MSEPLESLVSAAEQEWLAGWLAGPAFTRWEALPPQPGDPAPDLTLEMSTGEFRALSSAWEESPALLLFWRHAGCSCGMERAARLREELPAYQSAGANVVIVGMGEPTRAAAYAERQNLPVPFFCDPERKAYQAYGLLEGETPHLLFDATDDLLRRESEAGQNLQKSRTDTERALVDNPWQLPGEFVIDRQGIIRLAYRYQYCEGYPDPRVLIAAARFASGRI
jgi:peroxiredoxin